MGKATEQEAVTLEHRTSSLGSASDTPQDLEGTFREQVAALSPEERAVIADRLSRDVISAARAGIIASGRFATALQVHQELVRRLHGDALADEYFAHPAS
jgi:hypothetical protein